MVLYGYLVYKLTRVKYEAKFVSSGLCLFIETQIQPLFQNSVIDSDKSL